MSAASRAAVYFPICWRMASTAAWGSSSRLPCEAQDTASAIATQRLSARALRGMALCRFLPIDGLGDAKAVAESAKPVRPEGFLKRHADPRPLWHPLGHQL